MKTDCKYASNVTHRQWQVVRQLLPARPRRGRRPIDRRRIINAILYVVRTGCQWRMLPKDFPNWSTVYGIFWKWRIESVWQQIHDKLREKVRKATGKKSTPTVAITRLKAVFGDSAYGRSGSPDWIGETLGATDRVAPGWRQGVYGPTEAMDCGTHFCLAGTISSTKQRLRKNQGLQRSDHLHCDDQPDVAAAGKTTEISKHVLRATRSYDFECKKRKVQLPSKQAL